MIHRTFHYYFYLFDCCQKLHSYSKNNIQIWWMRHCFYILTLKCSVLIIIIIIHIKGQVTDSNYFYGVGI